MSDPQRIRELAHALNCSDGLIRYIEDMDELYARLREHGE